MARAPRSESRGDEHEGAKRGVMIGVYEGVGRVDGVDVGDCCFCIFDCLFGGLVAQIVGVEFRVHAYAADERSLALFETDIREQIRWSHVFCSVVRSGRGAVGQCSRYASGVDLAGFCEGREG